MSVSLRIHERPTEFKSTRVKFTTKEQSILNSYSVKTATKAAETAWKSVKKDTLAFANKLKRVRSVMVKGNSPQSLFSKWLKSVGIPRSTAYWTLKQSGGTSGKKQPSVRKLLQTRERLELQLQKAKKEEREGIKTKLDSIKGQLSRRREVLENRLKAISDDLKEVMNGIAAFSGTPEIRSFGFEKEVTAWMQSNDRMLSKMSTTQQQDFLRAITNVAADEMGIAQLKKPVGSVRSTTLAAAQA